MTKLARQFSWILAGRVLAAIIQASTLIILARVLEPQEFGLIAAVLGITIVLQALADLGVGKMLIRERARDKESSLLGGGIRLNSHSTGVLAVLLGLGFLIFGVFFDPRFLFMIPLAISVAGEKNADTWLGIAIADGDVRLNTTNLVVRRAIALISFLVLLQLAVAPILSYSLAVAVAAIFSVVFSRKIISHRVIGDHANFRETFRATFPYWVNTLVSQLRNLDAALIGLIAGTGVAGYYSAAARLTGPLRMLPDSLAVVLLPYATRARNRPLTNLYKILLVFLSPLAIIYCGLALVVPGAVPVVLGEDYVPAIPAIQIVLVGLVFSGMKSLLNSVMQGRGMQKQVASLAVVTTIYILVVLIILTPLFGANGAAIALASGFLIEALSLFCVLLIMEFKRKSLHELGD